MIELVIEFFQHKLSFPLWKWMIILFFARIAECILDDIAKGLRTYFRRKRKLKREAEIREILRDQYDRHSH
jgi:hypothetical protein